LQKVQNPKTDARNFPSAAINVELMRQTMQLGERYIDSVHAYRSDTWIIYYMYAMERFRSFQEHYTGSVSSKWYDDGVEFLASTQEKEGNWRFHMGQSVDTSFALLFLTRSTQKTIEREFGLGLVRGGRGLPSDISMVTIDEKTGNAINPELAGTIESLMTILEDPNNANFGALAANPDKFVETLVRPKEDEDQVARKQRIARLKEMVSKGDYQQRRIAVKALARTGDLNQAALLLYALTDPDPRVRWEADAGLRFISRKLNGFGRADTDEPEELEKLRLQWKQWYLAIRPDAELIE
jgi:HEAT repeat protein